MQGKICLITGGNSGIGKQTAIELAELGAKVVILVRSEQKGEEAQAAIQKQSRSREVEWVVCDLSIQQSIRDFAAAFQARYSHLYVLINNAATIPGRRLESADGIEMQLAVNHLAPYLLTNLLRDMLKASAPARVINLSSTLHRSGKIDFHDLQSKKGYSMAGWVQYGNTKLMNVLFTYELARRLQGTRVTANALHPGIYGTGLQRGTWLGRFGSFAIFPSARHSARGTVYLASSPDVARVSGKYFDVTRMVGSSPDSNNPAIARLLWGISGNLVGLTTSHQ